MHSLHGHRLLVGLAEHDHRHMRGLGLGELHIGQTGAIRQREIEQHQIDAAGLRAQ